MLEVNSCGGQNGRHSGHFALIVMMKIVSGLYATTASQRLTLFLLSTCSRDALSLYILVVLDQIKRKIDCNHCLTIHLEL